MIDTDKYEGHTSNWKWIYIDGEYHGIDLENGFYLYSLESVFGSKIIHDTPDGELAQDAPLLLAEVKRLYEMMDVLASFNIVKNVEQGFTQREWVELVESVKRGEEEE